MYNVVGAVKSLFISCHSFFAVPRTHLASRAGSEVKGAPRSGRSSKTLDAADGSPSWSTRRSFASSLSEICRWTSTKARSLESYGEFNELHQPCIRSQPQTMILVSELPFLCQGEAGRSLKKTIGFRLPRKMPGYPAWERRCSAELLLAASSTVAPPTFVRWPLSPPHYGRDGTLIADSPAAIPDRFAPPSAQLRRVRNASSHCPAY